MTREEAIARIKDHKIVHKMNEPRAIHISEALDMAIKALEQQPCEDCISRAGALRHRHIIYDDDGIGYSVVRVDEIEKLPSVTPQQKIGEWTNRYYIYADKIIEMQVCNNCGYEFSYDAETGISDANYCPKCGSKNDRK